ncbi:FAD/NAD(P)-binding domain-containing protein, partial [Wolfiporia cocos MD-104 SS10]
GGGIGGLCLAVALQRYADIHVDLYESTGRFSEIGAGVMLWSRTWHILSSLGLASELSRCAHAPPTDSPGVGFDFRKSDQPREGSRFYLFELPYGCIRFHRAHFLDVLVDRLDEGVAHFGKRLLQYSHQGDMKPLQLHFADGSIAECDLLVGCDGIKSTVRKQFLEEQARDGRPELLDLIDPVFTGTIAYRGLIPVHRLTRADGTQHRTVGTPMMVCRDTVMISLQHVVSYSISQGSVVNVVAFASRPEQEGSKYEDPWVTECTKHEVLDCYDGWEPEVGELLECIENPTRWAIHALRPLPVYAANNVVLLGDAAHAMCPHQGAGAGQAIEDAYILAGLLGHTATTRTTLPKALAAYERVRLLLANHILKGSRESGRLYEFIEVVDEISWSSLGERIGAQWDWLAATSPESEFERAIRWLQRELGQL